MGTNNFELREMGALAIPTCNICGGTRSKHEYESQGFTLRPRHPHGGLSRPPRIIPSGRRVVLLCKRCDLTGIDYGAKQ